MGVRLVTDSNAMLPATLVARFQITVVPLTVVVDGIDRPEDEVDPIEFCELLRAGATVTTAAPSPGALLDAYRSLADEGASEVVSIHIGSNRSATVGAAELAARESPVPITVVDTGTASFMQGCCVWRAAERLEGGDSVAEAITATHEVGATIASVFTIGEISRATDGGRLAVSDASDVPVFVSTGPDMRQAGTVRTAGEAATLMAEVVAVAEGPLRVGVGDADAEHGARALVEALGALANVIEVVRYTVGPSVAAHTGAGTIGAVYHRLT